MDGLRQPCEKLESANRPDWGQELPSPAANLAHRIELMAFDILAVKAFLRKLAERTVAGLIRALETCAEIFKPSECINYFKSCGYQDDTG